MSMHNTCISAFEVFVLKLTFRFRTAKIDGVQSTFHPVCIASSWQHGVNVCLYRLVCLSFNTAAKYSTRMFEWF